MNRVSKVMRDNQAQGRKSLVIYVTFGDPSAEESIDIMLAAAEAGADVIELGVPFSDPNADGEVIQRAMERALAKGGGMSSALAAVRTLRDRGSEMPVVLFGYYNPIAVRGTHEFAEAAAAAGVDAVLTVDLPMDELGELYGPLSEHGVGVVPLVAPTSGSDRIAAVRPFDPAFVYYVSMTGVTGAVLDKVERGPERVGEVRDASQAPVAVGFGIKTRADVERVASYADGVVVGSAVVRAIEAAGPGKAAEAVRALVADLRAGIP